MGWSRHRRGLPVSPTIVIHAKPSLRKVHRGAKYIAHGAPNLDWTCALTVKTREVWKQWRGRVFGKSIVVLVLDRLFSR